MTTSEQSRWQLSQTLLERCVSCLEATYAAGGHGHFEHPLDALSWQYPFLAQWQHALMEQDLVVCDQLCTLSHPCIPV